MNSNRKNDKEKLSITIDNSNSENLNIPKVELNLNIISRYSPVSLNKISISKDFTLLSLQNYLINKKIYNDVESDLILLYIEGTELPKEILSSLTIKEISKDDSITVKKIKKGNETDISNFHKRNISLQHFNNKYTQLSQFYERKNSYRPITGMSYDFSNPTNQNLISNGNIFERTKTYEKNAEEVVANLEKKHYFKDKSDLNKLGIILYEQGKYEEAIEFYQSAIELDDTFKAVYNNLGNAYRKLKLYNQAIEAYNKVLQLDPKCKEAHNGIGNTKDILKDYTGAIESYRKALIIDPNYKGAYNNLGKAQENLKMYAEALENYDKALVIDPMDKIARKNIDRCKRKAFNLGNQVNHAQATTQL